MAGRSVARAHKPTVYVTSYVFPELAKLVKKALPSVEVVHIPADSKHISDEHIATIQEKAEVVFSDGFLCKFFLNGCKKLKWIQVKNAGVDPVMGTIDSNNPPSILMTRTTTNDYYVGEYVITYILALEKNLLPMFESQTRRQWSQLDMCATRVLTSLNVCVLGVGTAGTEVARRCKQFGMKVTGVGKTSPAEKEVPPYFDRYTDNLEEALPHCDYLCSILPSTPETRDLLSGQLLSACLYNKTTLLSVGRGDVIDESTVVKAIREKWLRGAVLDVTPVEPLPDSSPLWGLKNVLITPHLSGYVLAPEAIDRMVDEFVENYELYCSGQKLNNEVDLRKGY